MPENNGRNNARKEQLADFAKRQQVIATNEQAYNRYYGNRSVRLRDYTSEELERIINNGSFEDQQRLSRNYYYKDGYYSKIINYYASILKYTGILIPHPNFGKDLSTPGIFKKYSQALDYVEKMNLPNFLLNCSLRALIDGSYYGLILNLDKNAFTVLDLPSGYCISRFKDVYGNDIVEFDVSYFNSIIDETAREEALSIYPKIVKDAYKRYIKGDYNSKWVKIPAGIGLCFPFSDGRPPFLTMLPSTIDYDNTVENTQEKDEEEIKKIVTQHIPHLTDGRLLFEPDEAEEIHAGTVGMLQNNPNVSVLTSYGDIDVIQSQTSSDAAKNTTLTQMLHRIYTKAGVSDEIFAATGSSTLPTSLKKDLAFMMILANKYSLFITNVVNSLYQNSNITFKYTILPISYYNEKDYIDSTFKLASSGYSLLLPALAVGLSQRDLIDIKNLENDALKLEEILIPLRSSYNISGDTSGNSVGRPKKQDEEKAEQTIANEKSLDNVALKEGSE